MNTFATIAQNQIDAIALIQSELLTKLRAGRIGFSASELTAYFSLIEKGLPLFGILPDNIGEQLTNTQLNQLITLILDNTQEGDPTMPIDQAKFDAALAELNRLKSDASDDAANKAALAQAQAELKSAQDNLATLQAKVDQLTSDDEADKAAVAKAQADLQSAEVAVKDAEDKANALIDQILPSPSAPTAPDVSPAL